MGQEIVYCSKCQNRLMGADFDKGKAYRIEGLVYCADCAPEDPGVVPSAPLPPDAVPEEGNEESGLPRPGSASRTPVARPPRRAVHGERRSNLLAIGLGVAGIAIVLIVIVSLAAGKPAPRPAPAAAAVPDPPEDAGRTPAPATPARAAPRSADPEPARNKERESRTTELAGIDDEVQAACAKEEFQRALGILEKAGPRHAGAEWTMWIEKRTADVHKRADALYAQVREKALAARRRGAADEARAASDRLARWGIQRLRDDLERALAAVSPDPAVPPPPPVSPDAKAFKAHWEAAAALAAGRDYAAAVAEVERSLPAIRDAGVRAEAAADLDGLRQASALLGEALQTLSKGPRGQKVALSCLDGTGTPRRVEGVVAKAEAHRIEVTTDAESVVVELGEVLPGSLADAGREKASKKPGADARAAVLWCLLEGDLEGARKHQGAPPLEVAEKYWVHARRESEARANPAPRERQARELFVSANREAGEARTASAAIQKYQALLKDYVETAFVRRNRSSIANSAEGGRDFLFFAADMTGEGAFRLVRSPKGESSWTTEADPDAARGADTFLSDLAWTSATSGWGPVEKDRANGEQGLGDGKTITLNGVAYPKGLGTHAPAELKYALGGKYAAFAADVGVDDDSGNGSVVFQVWADGTMLFDSGVMRQDTATKAVSLSVAGRQELRLVVTDAGDGITNDVASWGGARLLGGGGPPSLKTTRLDLEFSVLPDREYRCWLFVGACCAEALALQVQGTELVAPHPKTKEPSAAEPGGELSAPVKHGLSLATRTHAGHSARKGPARWGWAQVPLPRYSTPGAKKVRLLAEQRGLWVAYACVSAVKSAPPRESEVKELEKARLEVPARLPGEKGPGLILSNTSPKAYAWDLADVGKAQYVDRSFTFTSGPASFVGQRILRTANEDKSSKGNSLVTFEANQPVTVTVAHDERIATKPPWLAAYSATGEKVVTGAGTFGLFAREFPAGRVTLGGNTVDGQNSGLSMYSVAVRPRGGR